MRKNFKRMFCYSVFKKWSSSNFAVFCSMGKVIKIGALAVIYLQFANPKTVHAQDGDSIVKKFNLESVDVSGTLQPEAYSSVSRVVINIDKKEIERAAVTSINELLEYASNIDIRQRGVNGSQADISIRGGSFDQVLILLNGVNITDPQTGHHNLNLPVDLGAVERIEVLKGPGSWKFGPGAFTGAINIITSQSNQNSVQAAVEAGEYRFHSEKLSGNFQFGKTHHLISVNRLKTDGYIENTDFVQSNLFYRGGIEYASNEVSIQLGYTEKGAGSNSFYTPKYPNQYEATNTTFASIGLKTRSSSVEVEPKFYFRRNHDRFELFRDNAPSWYVSHNYHTTDVMGVNVLANLNIIANQSTTIGFDGRSETIWSNVLGELNDKPVQSPKYKDITLDYFHTRTTWSAIASHKMTFGCFNANLAINLSRNSDYDFKWFFYPAFDLSYLFHNHWSVYASSGKTMRLPTYTDLYYKGPTNLGNANLLPEESIGSEVGTKYSDGTFEVILSGFYRHGMNLIDWIKNTDETVWKSTNYTEINTFGTEFHSKINFDKIYSEQFILKNLSIDYTYIDQSKESGALVSYYVMDYLKHRLDIGVEHAVWENISASWHWSIQDRNGTYTQYINGSVGEEVAYAPFSLCDLKITWRKAGWVIFGSVNNMLNTSYLDISNVQQPGRWFKFGVSKKINL